MTNRETHCLIV